MNRSTWILAAAAAGALQAPGAAAAQWQLSTGVDYSRGDYGELAATEALVVPFSARVSFGALSVRASVPWLSVRGPADIAPIIDDSGGDRSSNSGSGSSGSGSGSDSGDDDDLEDFPDDRAEQGLGDATLAATWSFRDLGDTRLYIDLTGRVRLSTGDTARGLGRGTTDWSTLGEIGWDGRRGGVFLMGGRQFLESGAQSARRDVWQLGGGYWRNIGQRSQFGMQGNWRQASVPGNPEPQSLEMFLVRGLGAGWRMEVSGSAGLSRASADYSAGLRFTWRSARR